MDGNCLEVETGMASRCCHRWLSGSPNRRVVKHYALVAAAADDVVEGVEDDGDDKDKNDDEYDTQS